MPRETARRALPAAPVTILARATRRSSSRTARASAARDTGLPAGSTVAIVTWTPRVVRRKVTEARRSAAGRTVTDAVAWSEPAVAVTVPVATTRPARKVTAPPWPRTNVPRVTGATLHVTPDGTALPNESATAAVNVTSPRVRTSRDDGVTATRAAVAGRIVTWLVACEVPGAVAVSVAVPARVSR